MGQLCVVLGLIIKCYASVLFLHKSVSVSKISVIDCRHGTACYYNKTFYLKITEKSRVSVAGSSNDVSITSPLRLKSGLFATYFTSAVVQNPEGRGNYGCLRRIPGLAETVAIR